MQPRAELSPARFPTGRVCPNSQKNFLGDLLGIGVTAEHSPRQSEHARKVPVDELPTGRLIAKRNTRYQFVI